MVLKDKALGAHLTTSPVFLQGEPSGQVCDSMSELTISLMQFVKLQVPLLLIRYEVPMARS